MESHSALSQNEPDGRIDPEGGPFYLPPTSNSTSAQGTINVTEYDHYWEARNFL